MSNPADEHEMTQEQNAFFANPLTPTAPLASEGRRVGEGTMASPATTWDYGSGIDPLMENDAWAMGRALRQALPKTPSDTDMERLSPRSDESARTPGNEELGRRLREAMPEPSTPATEKRPRTTETPPKTPRISGMQHAVTEQAMSMSMGLPQMATPNNPFAELAHLIHQQTHAMNINSSKLENHISGEIGRIAHELRKVDIKAEKALQEAQKTSTTCRAIERVQEEQGREITKIKKDLEDLRRQGTGGSIMADKGLPRNQRSEVTVGGFPTDTPRAEIEEEIRQLLADTKATESAMGVWTTSKYASTGRVKFASPADAQSFINDVRAARSTERTTRWADITRSQFEQMCARDFQKAMHAVRSALPAEIEPSEVNGQQSNGCVWVRGVRVAEREFDAARTTFLTVGLLRSGISIESVRAAYDA